MWGKPIKPMLPRGQKYLGYGYSMHFWTAKKAQNPLKKAQTLSKRRKFGFLPWCVFVTQGCCATFGSINGQKAVLDFLKCSKPIIFDLQAHPKSDLFWLTCGVAEKFQWLDNLELYFLGKNEASISQTMQNKCKCGRKTLSYENNLKGKRYTIYCFLEGSGLCYKLILISQHLPTTSSQNLKVPMFANYLNVFTRFY